jgi:hypothetical protein
MAKRSEGSALTDHEVLDYAPVAAARVRTKTGMSLDLDRVALRVEGPAEVVTHIAEGQRALGLSTAGSWSQRMLAPVSRKLMESYVGSMLGIYHAGIETLSVVSPVVDPVASKITLFHELIHAAQFQQPGVLEEYAARLTALEAATTPAEQEEAHERVNAFMTILEGHAKHHDQVLERELGGRAPERLNAVTAAVGVAMLVMPTARKKMAQYPRGERVFERLETPSNHDVLARVFQEPVLCDLLARESGAVLVPATDDDDDERRAFLERLLTMRGERDLLASIEGPDIARGSTSWTVTLNAPFHGGPHASQIDDAARIVSRMGELLIDGSDVTVDVASERTLPASESVALLLDAQRPSGISGWFVGQAQSRLSAQLGTDQAATYDPSRKRVVVARDHAAWSSKNNGAHALLGALTHAALHQAVPTLGAESERRRQAMLDARTLSGRGSRAHTEALEAWATHDAIIAAAGNAVAKDAKWELSPTSSWSSPAGSLAAGALSLTPGGLSTTAARNKRTQAFLEALRDELPGRPAIGRVARLLLERPALVDVLARKQGRVEVAVVDDADRAKAQVMVDALARARVALGEPGDVEVAFV